MAGRSFTKWELIRSIARESFYDFVKEFWDTIIPEPAIWNWHVEYLCEQLQDMAERVFRGEPKKHDLIINIPPGTTKSTVCSIMFPAWCWTRAPFIRTIAGSYAERLALDLSRKCRDVLLSEKYTACFPEIALRDDQNTKGYFANTKSGIRYSVGVGGSVIGMHGHFLIIDDPIDPLKVLSEAELLAANTWMTEQLSQRKVDKRVTPTILIMQRLHMDDPTGNWLARNKDPKRLKHICLPAEINEHIKPKALAKRYKNNLLDPIRLNKEVLQEAEETLGPYGYASQFDQWPIPRSGGMFKTERIIVDEPVLKKLIRIVRYWDKAGTAGGGKYTAGVKMGVDKDGYYWILDVVRGQWETSRRESIIRATAEQDTYAVRIGIEQEPGSGGKESAEASIRNLAGFIVHADRVGKTAGNKIERADPFSVQVNGGNVRILDRPWTNDYLTELKWFGENAKYTDQVDASSGAFNMLAQPILKVGAF